MQTQAFAMLAALLYGTALVTTHFGLKHLPALAGARISIPSAMLVFWLLAPLYDWGGWQTGAAVIFAVIGLFYPAAVTLLTYGANRRLGPTVTGTIGSTTPLFAVLGAAAFLGETFGARELAATAAIVVGTMTLSRPAPGPVAAVSPAGLGMAGMSALLRALAQLAAKIGLVLWPSPFVAALLGYTVSSAVVWTAGALGRGRALPAADRRGAGWFALTGVLNGAMMVAMYYALSTGPVTVVAPIVATYPLCTLALSAVLVREERLSGRLAAGVALTVAGVVALVAA